MPIRTPAIQWPAELREAGPEEDPTIMLVGHARIADVDFTVTALRMRDGMRLPDYRDSVPRRHYEATMGAKLGDIEDLVDSIAPSLLSMHAARYLLWMVPVAHE